MSRWEVLASRNTTDEMRKMGKLIMIIIMLHVKKPSYPCRKNAMQCDFARTPKKKKRKKKNSEQPALVIDPIGTAPDHLSRDLDPPHRHPVLELHPAAPLHIHPMPPLLLHSALVLQPIETLAARLGELAAPPQRARRRGRGRVLGGVGGLAGEEDVEQGAQGGEAGAADGDRGLGGGPEGGVDVVPGRVVEEVEVGEHDEADDGDDADEAAADEDGGEDDFLGARGAQAPDHGDGRDPDGAVGREVSVGCRFRGFGGGDLRVEDDVNAAGPDEEFGNVDAVAGDVGLPELFDGGAFEDDGRHCRDQRSHSYGAKD